MKQKSINPQVSLYDNFEIADSARNVLDEGWNPIWGEVKTIRNHYKELAIKLEQKPLKVK